MARIKMAYIGGGSSRAAGTMASFIHQAENFDGSEVVLVDLHEDNLETVRTIADKLVTDRGVDITVTATTDRAAALADCDAVLTSFRPGDFAARALDERIPLEHGMIGQETQGAGGFFMALRSIQVMKQLVEEMGRACPDAVIFNYTNPVNLVSQAITANSDVPIASMCEGPIIFPGHVAYCAGLDYAKVESTMVGLNHNCWTVEHSYDGQDIFPLLAAAEERMREDPATDPAHLRLVHLANTMQSLPAYYLENYYFTDEVLAELRAKPTTRAEDILAQAPDFWDHYREQAREDVPVLDPERSRGGIHELELAFDVMDSYYNDKRETLPVNVRNDGQALTGLDEDVVVEVPCVVGHGSITPAGRYTLPRHLRPLVQQLAEYQVLAAQAAWDGTAQDAIRALTVNPLVGTLSRAERLYAAMSRAHAEHLPARLLA